MISEKWINETRHRVESNLPVIPEDREQLIWLCEHYPEFSGRWLPQPAQMCLSGLPAWYGRMKPLSERWREQVILTLLECPDFSKAVSIALGGVS